MLQGLACCECIWFNQCFSNVGVSIGLGCCSAWMFLPQDMENMRGPGCLKVGCNQGIGSSCFCQGHYICIPDWLRDYSIWESIGDHRGQLYNLNISQSTVPFQGYPGQGGNQYAQPPPPQPYGHNQYGRNY